jgi:SAM-dependent methyltransferase
MTRAAGAVDDMQAVAGAVLEALRWRVPIEDVAFDRLYPDHVRRLSSVHWTPVAVALRAAALLAPEDGMRVLDVGAGAGKLCCVGALAYGGTWHGVELDPSLVAAARATARCLEVERCTSFSAGDMTGLDWNRFDSLYFYNPFESQLFGHGAADPAGWTVFAEHVAHAEQRLSELPAGCRVVTFHGFGGEMPSCFALAFSEAIGEGQLALWIKQPRTRPGRGHADPRLG